MAFYNPYKKDDEKVTQPNFGGVRSVSFTDPNTINRQRALADSLRQQGSIPLQAQSVGGYLVPSTPLQGIDKVGKQLAAAFIEKKTREKEEANKQLNTNITSEMLRTAGSPVVERRPQTVDGQPVTQSQLMSNIQPTEIADAYSPEALSRASALGLGDPNASDATKQLALQLNLKGMEQAHGIKKAERAVVVAEKTRTKDMEDYKEKERFKNSFLKDKEPQNLTIFKTLYPDLDIASPEGRDAYDRVFGKKGDQNIINLPGKGKNQILQKVSEKQITQMYENAPQIKQNLSQSDTGLGLLREILRSGGTTSKLEPFFNTLNQYLGAITGDPDVLKGVSIKEAFNVLMGDKVMGRIQETKGAVSEKEMAYFGSISPGLDKTPFTNYLLLEIDRRAQERQLGKLKYIKKWFAGTDKNGEQRQSLFDDEGGFDEWYMKNYDPYGGEFDIKALRQDFDKFRMGDEEEPIDYLVKEYLK
jgi:hypothetical protein